MVDTAMAKSQFLDIFNTHVKREGAQKLLDYLANSDFFTAPASAKFHLCEEGGLCHHSVNVFNRLVKIVRDEYGDDFTSRFSYETLAVVSLLHDVCKVNYYSVDYRNVKEDGAWTKKPYYKVEEKFPYGHGEKSVFIILQYMRLTAEEAMAINWHMGAFDDRVKGGSYALSDAFAKYPLALFMHLADIQATYLDENRGQ